jgi:hypothetical protein
MVVIQKSYGHGITLTTKTQDGKRPAQAAVKFDGNKSRTFLGQGSDEYAMEFINELLGEYRRMENSAITKVFSLLKF